MAAFDAVLARLPAPAPVIEAGWAAWVIGRSGLLGPLRPDKYVRMAAAVAAQGITSTTGVALAARRCPDRVAVVDERGALTWRELATRCDALAHGLREVARGEGAARVALLARNHRGFVEALVATGLIGADLLLLNTGFAGPQLREVLEREQADLVVVDEEFTDLLPAGLPRVIAWQDTENAGGAVTVDELVERHLGDEPPTSGGTPHVVLLTSGTTGTPKGARRGAGGGADDLATVLDRVPWRTEETVVIAAPMFHAWGFGCLAIAATMACTMVMRRRFDAEEILALTARHRAAGLAVVPVMIERIADLPEVVLDRHPCPALRFVTASGSALDPSSLRRFSDRFGEVVHSHYNATEAGMIAIATPADLRAAPRSTGYPVHGCEVRILDAAGEPVGVGEVGEIAVGNGTQFEGYTGGGGREFREGLMLTGDLGRLDDAGRLTVEGRVDDMIVSGGENVYPAEVEDVLAAHPAVREAAVLGVADEEFGQRLVAFVALADEVTEDALRAHVKDQLAGYKVPRSVIVLDELPRNTAGKVVKRELAEG